MTTKAEPEQASFWSAFERASRSVAIVAMPVVLAIGGWAIQSSLQDQAVRRDYVQLAVTILRERTTDDPALRKWAVELLNRNSPVSLTPSVASALVSGQTVLPASTGECRYRLTSAKTISVASNGGTDVATLEVDSGTCFWAAAVADGVPWLRIEPAGGTGAIIVRITAAPNSTNETRAATLEIRWNGPQQGENILVSQAHEK